MLYQQLARMHELYTGTRGEQVVKLDQRSIHCRNPVRAMFLLQNQRFWPLCPIGMSYSDETTCDRLGKNFAIE